MWTAYGPDGEPDDEFYRSVSSPDNEIPVAVPVNRILARTEDAAIALIGLQVYSTGVEFRLTFRVRQPLEPAHRGLSELVFEDGHVPGRLLLGVEMADGRRATNVYGRGTSDGVVFHGGGGGGGQLSVDQSWWLHPLPPEGPLRFAVSCAALGIEETVVELDATVIRQAAEKVEELWPWSRPDPDGGQPTPPPDLPPGSWFAGP